MNEYKQGVKYQQREMDQEKFLELSPVIENAPYLLTGNYEQRLAGNSTGQSSSSSHSSNSSSHSASRAYVGSSTGQSSSSSHSSNSSSRSASRATVPLENRVKNSLFSL